MRTNHEGMLGNITGEYPAQVDDLVKYESIKSPVSKEFLEGLCEGDEALDELFDEMIRYFYRYTVDVCLQESLKQDEDGIQKNLEEIRAMEAPRTALHNAMIDSVKILARNLKNKEKDVSWLPDIDKKGRAGYAQLALSITLMDLLEYKRTHSEEGK